MIRTSVNSSNLDSVGYDPQTRILEIAFLDGSIYQYFDVPENIYKGLMNASSHGSFLDRYVKKAGFRYLRVS